MAQDAAKVGLGISICQVLIFVSLNKALTSMWVVLNVTQFIVYSSLWMIEFPPDLRFFFA